MVQLPKGNGCILPVPLFLTKAITSKTSSRFPCRRRSHRTHLHTLLFFPTDAGGLPAVRATHFTVSGTSSRDPSRPPGPSAAYAQTLAETKSQFVCRLRRLFILVADVVIRNIGQLVTMAGPARARIKPDLEQFEVIPNGCIVIQGETSSLFISMI